ncbi:MAG: PAS domain S-box protein [Blastocatellia bacterium]|nr:PAS domain S-box protein [Blastocatellia bacterium]MBN8722811.1 PAS domain S-box protein [Acidobacteriota bacterium]
MSETGYRILLVEDEEEHAELIKHVFQKESPNDIITHVSSAQQMWDSLRQHTKWDLFILDYSLPDTNGLGLLAELQMRKIERPIVIVTGYGDENIAVKAVKLGATDYLVKSPTFPQMLPSIAHRAIRSYQLRRRFDEAEAHLHFQALLLDNVHDAIIGTDMDSDIVYWNRGAERVFGWTASEILGHNIAKIIPAANQNQAQPQFDKLRLATEVNGEWPGIKADKTEIWLSVSTRLISDTKGTNMGLLNVAQDITEQKKLQEQTYQQLKHTEIVNRVLTAINASVEVEQLLPSIIELVKEAFNSDQVWFDPGKNLYFLQNQQKLVSTNSLALSAELSAEFYDNFQEYLLLQTEKIPIILDETSFSDDSWKEFLAKYQIKSQAFVILQPHSSSLWLIGLSFSKIKQWSSYEKNLLAELTRIIALALEKTLLYQRTHTAATYEQIINSVSLAISQSLNIDEILETVCTKLKNHLQVDRCLFLDVVESVNTQATVTHEKCDENWPKLLNNTYFYNDYSSEFKFLWNGKPWRISSLQKIMANLPEKLIAFIEAAKIKSILLVPVINRENKLIGAIALHQCACTRVWTDDEVRLVESIARQCIIAITNAQLYGESRKAEERYRSLFDNANDAIIIADITSGKIIDANARAEGLIGQKRGELLNSSLVSLHPQTEQNKYLLAYDSLQKTGYLYLRDASVEQKDGTTLPVELRASIIVIGKDSLIQAILRDMTEQRKLEQQLFHSQRLESIGTLTGGIAHDFNNLLAGILGYAELFKKKLDPSNTKLYNYAGIIEQSATHGAELAQRLVAFARGGSPKAQLIDLNTIVEDTLKLLKRALGKTIEIRSELESKLDLIEANPTQIQQILMNLCINARDAMPNGGMLTVITRNVEIEEQPFNSVLKSGSYVSLSVQDNGTGMDAQTLTRIFEPFFTTKEIGKGTGLGLAMVSTIVREAKGHVEVMTKLGQGTTFQISLPAVNKNITHSTNNQTSILSGTETILVVDDEETLRHLAKDLLESYGYKILMAADGPEALDIYQSKYKEISLLLLDMVMPKMGGREVYQKALEINPKARVVFASGYCPPEEMELVWEKSVMGFVQKPYQIEDLTSELRRVLDKI